MKFLVLSTSLSPSSRSRILARAAFDRLPDVHESTWMDLQTEGLPLCDGGPAADERVDRIRRAVASCDGILITFGIYNYLAPAATKNAVEWAREEPRLKEKWWLSRRSEVDLDPCRALQA